MSFLFSLTLFGVYKSTWAWKASGGVQWNRDFVDKLLNQESLWILKTNTCVISAMEIDFYKILSKQKTNTAQEYAKEKNFFYLAWGDEDGKVYVSQLSQNN